MKKVAVLLSPEEIVPRFMKFEYELDFSNPSGRAISALTKFASPPPIFSIVTSNLMSFWSARIWGGELFMSPIIRSALSEFTDIWNSSS